MPNTTHSLRALTIIGGGLMAIIGVRFYVISEHAARVFGIGPQGSGFELHHVIAARDIWLGLLAIGLAVLRQWTALTLWFGLAVLVCLSDAYVVIGSGGKSGPLIFHLASAVACAAMAWMCQKASRQLRP